MLNRKNGKVEETCENSKKKLRERFADILDTSKEIILNTAKITAIGNNEMTIENYKAIIEYTNSIVKISCNPKVIQIKGNSLEIKTVTKEILYITGIIKSIEFIK